MSRNADSGVSEPPVKQVDSDISNGERSTPALKLEWWHIAIGLFMVALFTILAPRGKSLEFANLIEGSISHTKIIAPFDFELLKTDDELKSERQEAVNSVYPVVTASDSIRDRFSAELKRFADRSYILIAQLGPAHFTRLDDPTVILDEQDSLDFSEMTDKIFRTFGIRLSRDTWLYLQGLFQLDQRIDEGIYNRYFETYVGVILLDAYSRGIVDVNKRLLEHPSGKVMLQNRGEESSYDQTLLLTPSEALNRITFLLSETNSGIDIPEGGVSPGYDILQPFVVPNVIYDKVETERRKQAAIAKVPLARGFVQKDELIIDSNIKVTSEHAAKLNSLAVKRAEMQTGRGGIVTVLPTLGHLLLALVIIFLLGLFIAFVRPAIWSDWKLMLLVAVIIGGVHLFQGLSMVRNDWSVYLFPVGVAAMLVAILIDRGVALGTVVAVALISGLLGGHSFPMVLSSIAVGSAALFAVKQVRNRSDVMRASIYLLAMYIPIVTAFHFVSYTSLSAYGLDLMIAGANSLISPILVLGLLIIFELGFRLTTDLTLMELVDLNRPLLRELALKSPGTYHHSIMVGSLAESAARTIGANALLTRAGAYYHDIGKIDHREYFIENQESGSRNIHDRLAPEKSAEIVIEHVTRGLELADKHRLPPQVKAFIAEHHGKSKLAFFYEKAKREQGEDISEINFRYPGPNPQSKETAILMLADIVEAATRSSEPNGIDKLRETVDALINKRLTGGDLDHSPLTLSEIRLIKMAFVQVLSGIYHQRIPYPGQQSLSSQKGNVVKPDVQNGVELG